MHSPGELWFQRPGMTAPPQALLLKLLFTNEALSIQVHPDDAFAQSIGMAHGKTEAWYILSKSNWELHAEHETWLTNGSSE